MNFWAEHPVLYQLRHPWHWLTYGQNGLTLAGIAATIVSALSVYVLIRTLSAINRQAIAADRQAEAAEEQAKVARVQAVVAEKQVIAAERAAVAAEEQLAAARASSVLSEAHLSAAQETAAAEREHTSILRQQLLAILQPSLRLLWIASSDGPPGSEVMGVENLASSSTAYDVRVLRRDFPAFDKDHLRISIDLFSPEQKTIGPRSITYVRDIPRPHCKDGLYQLTWRSEDGRDFEVTYAVSDGAISDTGYKKFDLRSTAKSMIQNFVKTTAERGMQITSLEVIEQEAASQSRSVKGIPTHCESRDGDPLSESQ